MSSFAPLDLGSPARPLLTARLTFLTAALGLVVGAAVLAGWLPIEFSVATVFLFAGPHNWLEFRYFLTRMPGRWGKLRGFFLFAFAGLGVLSVAFIGILGLAAYTRLTYDGLDVLLALWNTGLLLWVAALVHWRSTQNPRRAWGWVWPVAFALVAVAWLWPAPFGLALVYLHPLMAFWLLDRELKRTRPAWRTPFHVCLCAVPLALAALWWRLAASPELPLSTELEQRIGEHAGFGLVPGVSSHFLVAAHTFLEMLHYGVWVLAIPLVGYGAAPWGFGGVPLARRSAAWRWGLGVFLACGAGVVLALWGCFLVDYTTTRAVYFTVALVHVLAEVPFLLRAL